jgi:signal transduction histidine kinase
VDRVKDNFDAILKQEPPDLAVLRQMGAACSHRGDHEIAARIYQKILEIRPDDSFALNELGVIYGKRGDFIKAVQLLDRVLAENPNDIYVLSELGLIHSREGETEKAASYFEQIIKNSRANFLESFKNTSDLQTIGDPRERDRQFIASGRITTVNAIATCFAHQINNPLQMIQEAVYSLSAKAQSGGASIEADLKVLRESADRIHQMIQHLYKLIEPNSGEQEFLSVSKVILSAFALFKEQLKNRNITVELGDLQAPRSTAAVYGNSVELEQVFINLFANARDALAATPDPRITVSMIQSSEKEITIHFSDNGEGISEENLDRVFDTLFTTKPQGTGLGLWLCFSVINQMEGEISVDSVPGKGTIFTIRLPTNTTCDLFS